MKKLILLLCLFFSIVNFANAEQISKWYFGGDVSIKVNKMISDGWRVVAVAGSDGGYLVIYER